MRKYLAFTLSEILIVLGVIAVISVITLPNLIVRIQERIWLTQFNKVTSSLQNAYKLIYEDYGSTNNWQLNDISYDKVSIDKVVSLFSMYIPQMSNEIQQSDYNRYVLYNLQGKKSSIVSKNNFKGYYMMDGSVVFVTVITSSVDSSSSKYGPLVNMIVDINGLKKGPNTIGKDIFLLYLGRNKPVLTGYPLWWVNRGHCSVKNPTGGWTSGGACANWILKTRNMDYLHREITAGEWYRVMQW